MFEEIILLLFIALSKSKDYKCFAKLVPRLLQCFTTVTLKIVTLNKEESSTVIRCMINQNMKTGGVSFTQQSGGLRTWGDFICDFFCFVQINCLQPQKAFYKIIKKIDVHSVFKNGFIQRNSLFVVWVLQLVRVFLLWSAVLQTAEVRARSLVVIVWNGRGESSVVELSILPSLLQVFMLERDAF